MLISLNLWEKVSFLRELRENQYLELISTERLVSGEVDKNLERFRHLLIKNNFL